MWQYNYSPSNGNDFLAHAGQGGKGFKYVRKYRGKNGKWIYEYKNNKTGATKRINDTDKLITDSETRQTFGNGKHEDIDYYRSKASRAIDKYKAKQKAKKAAKPTAKSIAKAVGKSSKAITNRYKKHEVHDDVPVYRSGKNEKVHRVRKFKRVW